MKQYHKLVRDNIPAIIRENDQEPITHQASEEAIRKHLRAKLQEETREYCQTESVEELADILEVLHALCSEQDVSFEQIETKRLRKREERGGFEDGIILERVLD